MKPVCAEIDIIYKGPFHEMYHPFSSRQTERYITSQSAVSRLLTSQCGTSTPQIRANQGVMAGFGMRKDKTSSQY